MVPLSGHEPPAWLSLVTTLPATLWLIAIAVLLVLSLAGIPTFLDPPEITLSEAAALQDDGEIARLIAAGADPDGPARVRAGILAGEDLTLSPLEAAVASRRADVVLFLVESGAIIDDRNYPSLRCLAALYDDAEVIAALDGSTRRATPDCSTVALRWRP